MRERLEYPKESRKGPMAMAFSGDFSWLDSAFGPAVVVYLAGRSWLGLALRDLAWAIPGLALDTRHSGTVQRRLGTLKGRLQLTFV